MVILVISSAVAADCSQLHRSGSLEGRRVVQWGEEGGGMVGVPLGKRAAVCDCYPKCARRARRADGSSQE